MAARRPTSSRGAGATEEPVDPPEGFRRALTSLRAAVVRPEVVLDEAPAPQRLAPYAVALSAEVRPGSLGTADDELATGRLVVLYDPRGQEAWDGPIRVVAYVRASCEPEMAADPLLPAVGWSWLVEALEERSAPFTAASGTVTRVASESFGGMAGTPASAEIEIRASWSPTTDELGRHLEGWADLLCQAAGLPPLPPGVATIAPGTPRPRTAR